MSANCRIYTECQKSCTTFIAVLLFQTLMALKIKPLQALHDTQPCAYFCCCTCFGIKNINVSTSFDQIHQSFHKILSINIVLISIKGHNSVEKIGENKVY